MKKYILLTLIASFSISSPLQAQVQDTDGYMPNQGMQEYFSAAQNDYSKSIIYIFFNNQPCYTCADTIEMIENIYNQNFIDQYNMFIINYANDDENNFINTYQLSQPLEVVLVRVDDGATFGYQKIENLQNMTSDPISFKKYFIEEVNDFLGNQ